MNTQSYNTNDIVKSDGGSWGSVKFKKKGDHLLSVFFTIIVKNANCAGGCTVHAFPKHIIQGTIAYSFSSLLII